MILNGSMYMLRPFDKEGKPVRHQDPQLESTLKEIYEIVSDRSLPPLRPAAERLSSEGGGSNLCRGRAAE